MPLDGGRQSILFHCRRISVQSQLWSFDPRVLLTGTFGIAIKLIKFVFFYVSWWPFFQDLIATTLSVPWKVDSTGRKNERKGHGKSKFFLINKQSWHHHSNTKKVTLTMSIYCESFFVPIKKKNNREKKAHKSKTYTIITKRTETWRRNNCLKLETRK